MNIPSEVRRIVQARLAERVEDYAILRGEPGREWNAAYERLLGHVYQRVRKQTGEDWREWAEIKDRVMQTVTECCEELRRGT